MRIKLNFLLLSGLALALISFYIKPLPHALRQYLIISTGAIATIPVVLGALSALRNRKISVDLLASIALFVSILKQEWASVAFINLMITSARIFGDYTEDKARTAIKSLLKLKPEIVKIKKGSKIVRVHISEVQLGDRAIIESGDRIPVDGVVVEGNAEIDQSSLTGESIPIPKGKGDKVFSSTLNVSGSLIVQTQKIGKETTFEKILALVEEAQEGKIEIQTTADKFASFYILITLVGSGLLWFISKDLTLVLSVLLVTCADDIAVAIPMAFWSAIGYAARHGIIIKGGNFIEGLANIKTLIADKTGTLTKGKIKAEEVIPFKKRDPKEVLKLAAIAESVSQHPIAKAVTFYAERKGVKIETPEIFNETPGKGIVAKWSGKEIVAGRLTFLEEKVIELSDQERSQINNYQNEGSNIVGVAYAGQVVGFIALADEVRPETRKTIEKIKELGVEKVIMLTGDNERVAAKIARQTGIDEFHANLLPEGKVKFVKEHLSQKNKLAMVGDGVNDAASLAASDIGIAMGVIGSDAAIEAADVALMQDNFSKITEAIELGKFTTKIAKENFIIWGVVNIIGLILVFSKVIGPPGAAAYNFATDFFPLINSLRMLRYKKEGYSK